MTRIELYFEEIDRRIRSGIPFTPPVLYLVLVQVH